jgi:hypothetical protein
MASGGATSPVKRSIKRVLLVAALLSLITPVFAQGRGGGRGGRGAALNPRTAAAFDPTGYWVSVVTEDWMYRMVTPPKGKYLGVPMNAEARKIADAWDPAKDESEGDQCKAYGAPALMRIPGRLHIAWENDTTLRIDTDAGLQTRVFHFGASAPKDLEPSWQGYSIAQWEYAAPSGGRGAARMGDLKVVTTNLKAGYLRKNGVPYSANAVLNEYYDLHAAPNDDTWLVVTTEVVDPQYLTTPFLTSTHFKKQADSSGWMPEPCAAR